MEYQLNQIEVLVLLGLFKATRGSIHAHPPIEAIQSNVKPKFHKHLKKAVKKLCTKGFILQHKTRGGVTYNLTKEGLNTARGIINNF